MNDEIEKESLADEFRSLAAYYNEHKGDIALKRLLDDMRKEAETGATIFYTQIYEYGSAYYLPEDIVLAIIDKLKTLDFRVFPTSCKFGKTTGWMIRWD